MFPRSPCRVVTALLFCTAVGVGAEEISVATEIPGRDVDSLLVIARANNPALAVTRHTADAMAARGEWADALPDPMLLAELRDVTNEASGDGPNLIPSRVGSTRYQFSQKLPGWGKRDLMRSVAEADTDEARFRVLAAWNDLSAQIKSVYSQYWQVSKSLAVTRELRDLVVRLERIARQRYENGLSAQQDVIGAQVELSNVDSEIVVMEAERSAVVASLNSLLPRSVLAPLAEPEMQRAIPSGLALATLEARLRERSPRLQAEAARRRSSEQRRSLTYKNREVDWQVGVGAVQKGNRIAEWGLMVEMNLPLQQGSRRAQEREAEAELAASVSREEAAVQELLGELGRAVAGVDAAQRTEALAEKSFLPQAQLNFQAALVGYETGKADFATLLDAQRQIRRARLMAIRAQAEARMRLAEIERVLGEEQ